MIHPTPKHEGFFWAKWRIADEGTDKCRQCGHNNSDWEKEGQSPATVDEWEVVRVVENRLDHDHPDAWMAEVPGVSTWQSIENFYWGPQVHPPVEAYIK